ncbi:aldo/keto reductase [Cystobacter ferrugineus]|uniref:Aldo/keto reductase n=1 Tax=Cystobacter ferrugineus TaxID=83449 RepID=A0A1L9BJH7_9BACT|nr:aldo/keto reductase [Cystobacter ferrugineus]OJH42403.1 aldo/keto reductase [Cystobacter ferrugineus]
MRYNILGRTGLFVSELCLGTMNFGTNLGKYAAAGGLEERDALPLFARAFDAGINFVDTANVYASGQSEEITGRAIRSLGISRHDVIVATKVEHAVGTGPNDAGATRHHLLHQVKASLTRLGTDYIDLYQLHGWDPVTPLEETIRALDDLVRQGHVRYVGVSNWAAWQVVKALGIAERLNASPFQSFQGYYSLASRDLERELAPMLASERLALMVFSPLAGGFLTGKYQHGGNGRRSAIPFPPVDEARGERVLAAMDGVAAAHGVPLATIALAWLLHRRVVTSVILGAKRLAQLEDQLKAVDVTLSDDEIRTLTDASALSVEYPGWALRVNDAPREALLQTGRLPTED